MTIKNAIEKLGLKTKRELSIKLFLSKEYLDRKNENKELSERNTKIVLLLLENQRLQAKLLA